MSDVLIWGLAGAFIAWNLPQPPWAVWIQAKVIELFNKIKAKIVS